MTRTINQNGLQLIKQLEGFRGNYYNDQIGQKTIGYGHCIQYRGPIEPRYRVPLSESDASRLLREDLHLDEEFVQRVTNGRLNDNQFAACVSFSFNMGTEAFRGTQILTNILAGNYAAAGQAFGRYNSMQGQVLDDLTERRRQERQLFESRY
ncbi:uncharacterized protein LOC128952333 [Oppia nitens]|uniref:uncharacterized protein LOC128952333 n=1 Tax=Oppia nitens TaxID=1686743 RepID=UPI0023DCE5DE|nr:uncharacterized protein LOC128952333 [Oppia nitens]